MFIFLLNKKIKIFDFFYLIKNNLLISMIIIELKILIMNSFLLIDYLKPKHLVFFIQLKNKLKSKNAKIWATEKTIKLENVKSKEKEFLQGGEFQRWVSLNDKYQELSKGYP